MKKIIISTLLILTINIPLLGMSHSEKCICHAARKGDIEEMKRFLDEKRIDINAKALGGSDNCYFDSPLFIACKRAPIPAIAFLLLRGADSGYTDDLCGFTVLHEACYWGREDLLDLLITPKAPLNAVNSSRRQTVLHMACAKNMKCTVQQLLQAGAQPDIEDGDNKTPAELTNDSKIKSLFVSFVRGSGQRRPQESKK